MMPVRLEPAALRSQVKHSTTEHDVTVTLGWQDSICAPSVDYFPLLSESEKKLTDPDILPQLFITELSGSLKQ